MRLELKTDGVQFRVASPAKPKQDYKDKDRQAVTRDGEPIWTVRLDAIDHDRETKETIWVEVAGEQPRLTFDDFGVVRKGSRALQMLPASADAFVWLRLYQHHLGDEAPAGPDDPLWWTLRRPYRPLSYDAARMMFKRAQRALGSNWTLHDLRHSAAYRMVHRR
jgi:hypothetical protein